MPEVLRGRIYQTDTVVEVEDAVPLASAVQFKALSDRLWAQKDKKDPYHRLEFRSVVDPVEARDAVNAIVGEVDERFVISGIGQALKLGESSGRSTVIGPDIIDNPRLATIETLNVDHHCDHRFISHEGQSTAVEFLDDHLDYYRQLAVRFYTACATIITYSMERTQPHQAETTNLNLGVWQAAYAETGYEGHQILHKAIDESHETRLLDLMHDMSGLKPLTTVQPSK